MSGSHSRHTASRTSASGKQRIGQPDLRCDVHAERAVAAGVQHVVRRQLLELERHLRAVRVLDRMNDDVDLLQNRLERRIGHEQLREAQDMARRRHFVRVLPSRDEQRRLERRQLRARDELARRRVGDLHHRDVAAAIRMPGPVGLDLGVRGELSDDLLALVRTDDVIPRHDRPLCRRPRRATHVGRRRAAGRLEDAPSPARP